MILVRQGIVSDVPAPTRLIATAIVTALLVVACGGSAAVTGPPTVPSQPASNAPSASSAPASAATTPAPSPTPDKGPATGTFGLVGTLGLKGQFTASSISCNYPTPTGPQIIAFGQIGTNGPFVQVFVTPGSALVRADTGSGTTFKMRTFTGSGVTGFDGATGAQIDTTLTENTDKSLSTTGIGVISSITGKIDCGDQTAGTSTITVTGMTPQGPLAGPLTLPKVTCNIVTTGTPAGTYVNEVALGQIGSTTVSVNITTGAHQVTFFETSGLGQTFFSDYNSSAATVSPTGVHVSGDISQQSTASPPPSPLFTVHIEGDATCGTTTHS